MNRRTGIEPFVQSDWPIMLLDDIKASTKYAFVGGPFGSNLTADDYVDAPGVPVIRGTNLGGKESRFIDDNFVFVSESKAASLLQNTACPGDLVFTQRGTLGQVAEIPINSRFERYVISQSQMKLTVDQDLADPRFVYHFYRSPLAMACLRQRIQATGVPHINLSILKEFPIPLPPLPEQRRIAAILDKADAIRRKRQKAIELTEQFLKSAFLEMFGDPVTNPKGWERVRLGNLCSIRRGSSPRPIADYVGGTVPWIKIGDATKGDELYITKTAEHIIEAGVGKSVLLKPGTLVFANCGVSLGFARILQLEGCIHDGWLSFDEFDSRLNKIFLLKLLNQMTRHFQQIAPEGTQPNLTTSIMKAFEVPVPPLDAQKKYEQLVLTHNVAVKRLFRSSEEAASMFNSLVQRAFRGELSTAEVPS